MRAESLTDRRTAAAARPVVVEGAGSFGVIVTAKLVAACRAVVDAARISAGDHRGRGTTDELDAARIARAVVGLAVADMRTRRPRVADRARAAIRVLVAAREQMTAERTRVINELTASMRSADLGVCARRPLAA